MKDESSLNSVQELRRAIEEGTREVGQLTFVFLVIGLYIAVLVGIVDDETLLRSRMRLPLLDAEVDARWVFGLAPLIVLLFHFWLLRLLVSLSRRIDAFLGALAQLSEEVAAAERRLVPIFPYVEWRAGFSMSRWDRLLGATASWVMYVGVPLGLLLWIERCFLAYQHPVLTPLHVLCVASDLTITWAMWSEINGPTRSPQARSFGLAASALALGMAGLGWLDQHTSYLFSRLTVSNRILLEREPDPTIIAQYRQRAEPGQEEQAERQAFLDEELTEPLDLGHRHLRRADLSKSRLFRANLSGADLRGASLREAQIPFAYLDAARLDRADLMSAQAQRASFIAVDGYEAKLAGALLQDVDMYRSDFRGADFSRASLQGVNLEQANLTGADLSSADLLAADLSDTEMKGADLSGAHLHLARLRGAQLQGANLTGAQMHAAYLDNADLSAADLQDATLWGVNLMMPASLAAADFRSVVVTPPILEEREQIRTQILKSDMDDKQRKHVLNLYSEAIAAKPIKPMPRDLSKNESILVDHLKVPFASIVDAIDDQKIYRQQLVKLLVPLGCSDYLILKGIVKRLLGEGQGKFLGEDPARDWAAFARGALERCPGLVGQLHGAYHNAIQANLAPPSK